MKILSLLPSATEIVCELGLTEDLVGVSGDCDYPDYVSELPRVSATEIDSDRSSREIDESVKSKRHAGRSLYHLEEQRLRELDPDLVLTQEQCEVCAPSFDAVQSVCRILEEEPKIVSLEVHSLQDVLEGIRTVGQLTDRAGRAKDLTEQLKEQKRRVFEAVNPDAEAGRCLTLEWLDPPYVGGHWLPEMVRGLGYESFREPGEPSKEVTPQAIEDYDPDVSILMPCGFGLERAVEEGRRFLESYDAGTERLGSRVVAVDSSSYFSRPGPRLFEGLATMAKILHPSRFKTLPEPDETRKRLV